MPQHVLPTARDLRNIAAGAGKVIQCGQAAYAIGCLTEPMKDMLKTMQFDLIKLLALFEDGRGYGHAPVSIVLHFRMLEQVATDLLEADRVQSAHRNADS